MNASTATSPSFSAQRASLTLGAVMAVGVAAAAGVVTLLGRPEQLLPAATGAAVCLLASLASLAPVCWASRGEAERMTSACLLAMLVRLGLTVVGGALAGVALKLDLPTLGLWMVLWYVLLLAVESRMLVRYFGSLTVGADSHAATPPDPRPSPAAAEARS